MIQTRVWKRASRIAAGICCMALVFALFSFFGKENVSAKITENELNARIEELQAELKEAENARKDAAKQYDAVKDRYEDLQSRKEAIDTEMEAIEGEADALRKLILGYDEQVDLLNRRIVALEIELDDRMEILKQRLRADYENGRADIFAALLTSTGLYDFLTAAERLTVLAKQDEILIRQCEEATVALKEEKELLFQTVSAASEKTQALRTALSDLSQKQAETENMMKELESDVEAYEKALEQAEKAEEEFRTALQKKLELLAALDSTEYTGGDFLWPLPAKYKKISSHFGPRTHPVTGKPQFHEGIDIPAAYKTDIYCVANGVVIETGTHYANGKYVIVNHGGGITSSYAHLSRIDVKEGDILEKGDVLGLVGATGYATGNHLDLSVYEKGKAVDPLKYYPDRQ